MSTDNSTQTLHVPASPFSISSTRTERSPSVNGFDVDLERGLIDSHSQQQGGRPSAPSSTTDSSNQTRVGGHSKSSRPPNLALGKWAESENQTVISSGPMTTPGPKTGMSEICFLSEVEGAKLIQGHLDAIVIVAALLLAVDAAFVIEGLKLLAPDPLEAHTKLLRSIVMAQVNTTAKLDDLLYLEPFVPDPNAVQANRYLVASLCLCLAAVCGAMGGKDATLHGVHKIRGCQNLGRMGVRTLLMVLHQLIFAAVVTFFVGFIKQVACIDHSIKNLALGFAVVSILLYLAPGVIRHIFRMFRDAKSS